MIEPRAWMVHSGEIWSTPKCPYNDERGEPLYALADVLAALRQPSEAMIEAGDKKYEGTLIVEEAFLAMLDAFEKEQSSPAKKAYEAANPLGGPARMFEAIAERIRSGEEYYAVLKDYGVTVEAK